jgi:hypothetical protein
MADDKPEPGNLAQVHPVTGEVLEDEALRARGLALLRARMAAVLDEKLLEKFVRDDDQFLLAFLRARKYNIEKVRRVDTVHGAFAAEPSASDVDGACFKGN